MPTKLTQTGAEIQALLNKISESLIALSYSELVKLRDAGKLLSGQPYRITDYATTTSKVYTKSAGHPFDIIVFAISENVLSENAMCALHEGDEYFAESNIESWRIKYCLDNDTSRFDWADTENGKGVVYWMEDQNRNFAPYDFKNILVHGEILRDRSQAALSACPIPIDNKLLTIIGSSYYYMFSSEDGTVDRSLKGSYIKNSGFKVTGASHNFQELSPSAILCPKDYAILSFQVDHGHWSGIVLTCTLGLPDDGSVAVSIKDLTNSIIVTSRMSHFTANTITNSYIYALVQLNDLDLGAIYDSAISTEYFYNCSIGVLSNSYIQMTTAINSMVIKGRGTNLVFAGDQLSRVEFSSVEGFEYIGEPSEKIGNFYSNCPFINGYSGGSRMDMKEFLLPMNSYPQKLCYKYDGTIASIYEYDNAGVPSLFMISPLNGADVVKNVFKDNNLAERLGEPISCLVKKEDSEKHYRQMTLVTTKVSESQYRIDFSEIGSAPYTGGIDDSGLAVSQELLWTPGTTTLVKKTISYLYDLPSDYVFPLGERKIPDTFFINLSGLLSSYGYEYDNQGYFSPYILEKFFGMSVTELRSMITSPLVKVVSCNTTDDNKPLQVEGLIPLTKRTGDRSTKDTILLEFAGPEFFLTISLDDQNRMQFSTERRTFLTEEKANATFVSKDDLATINGRRIDNGDNIEIEADKLLLNTLYPQLFGKKYAALGDSLTNGTGAKPYCQVAAEYFGMNLINYGITSSTLAEYDEAGGGYEPMSVRYANMDADAEVVTIMGGTNDIYSKIGTMADRQEDGIYTLYSGAHKLFKGIMEKYPNAKVGVILPPQFAKCLPTDTEGNGPDINLEKHQARLAAIKEVAEYYSLPVLDLFHHGGINGYGAVQRELFYQADKLHLTTAGQARLAEKVIAWMKTL